MNVQEAHIQLDQAFDKIASDQYDNLIPEEKDLWLDKAQIAFIKERVKPQQYWPRLFQGSKPQYNNVENLVRVVDMPLYVVDSKTVKGQLPNDYFMAIGERVKVAPCLSGLPDTFDPGRQVIYYTFPDDSGPNYWQELKLDLFNGVSLTTIIDSTKFPTYRNGVRDKELSYFIIKHLIERQSEITATNVKMYWEWFDGVHRENTIIFEINDKTDWLTLITYLDAVNVQTDPVSDLESLQYNFNGVNIYEDYQECRLVKHEELGNMLNNEFYTTTPDSPIVTINQSEIYVHHNSSFVPSELKLTYLRHPRRFDNVANQSFEVHTGFHHDIVDKCVEMLTAAIGAETHNLIKVNNQTTK